MHDAECIAYFVDYTNAFDRCQYEELMESLRPVEIDAKDMRIISNLNWRQKEIMRIEGKDSKPVEIRSGVRQGCLFNLFSENIIERALDGKQSGI